MERGRTNFDGHWQEVRDNINPEGSDFTTSRAPGTKSRTGINDNTAEDAAEMMANGLHGIMTSPARRWFSIRAKRELLNEIPHVARWLQHATRITATYFSSPEHGFHQAAAEAYGDLTLYGNEGIFIGEIPGFGPLFQARPLRELFIGENDKGQVDTVYRNFQMSARQAVLQFESKAGAKIIKANNDPKTREQQFPFIHATEPREDFTGGGIGGMNMPWASVYINKAEKIVVRESGFPEFPWAFGRWKKRAGELYARSAGTKALPDVKMLQRMARATIRGAEKIIDPSLMVPDDGVFGNVRMSVSGITTVRADLMAMRRDPIRPITSGARPDLGEDLMESVRNRIRRAFYNDLFRMFEDPRLTATQVLQEVEEQLRILGPFLGRLEAEKLDRLIKRSVAILLRMGVFPPVPPELAGETLEIEYQSPIARAQRFTEARAITATFSLVAPIGEIQPEIYDNIDGDKIFSVAARMFDFPMDTVRDPRLVRQIRQARHETESNQMMKEDVIAGAGALAKVIPAMGGREVANAA